MIRPGRALSIHEVGAGKLFATFYCLSGIKLSDIDGDILGPIYHDFCHTFHLRKRRGKNGN